MKRAPISYTVIKLIAEFMEKSQKERKNTIFTSDVRNEKRFAFEESKSLKLLINNIKLKAQRSIKV